MTKKTVLTTGCSDDGIGAAMAKVFHNQGYHVFATLRNTTKAKSLAQIDGIEILELEVTSNKSIEQCVQAVQKRTDGSLDVLVNNAGADFAMPLLDVSMDEAKKLYDLNVWSILAMTQAFAPMLIKAEGAICNITSVAAVLPLAWAASGLRVLTGMIGAVATPIHENAGELNIPTGSYYQQIRETTNNQRKGLLKSGSQQVDVTATSIVQDIIGARSGLIWRGGAASFVRYVTWLWPLRLVEYVLNRNRGLSEVGVNKAK